tara:strand:- start:277 stop:510 length:234 start_codon:yes stop_codon:yes gene_type:complete
MNIFKGQEVIEFSRSFQLISTARSIWLSLNGRMDLLAENVVTKEVKYEKITHEHAINVAIQKVLEQAPCSIRSNLGF